MGEFMLAIETEQWKWLVDTGSPRSFVSQATTNWLTTKPGQKIQKQGNQSGRFQVL